MAPARLRAARKVRVALQGRELELGTLRNVLRSPSRVTAKASSVRTGDFAWHCVSRKVEKSCRPVSACAASCIAAASSGRLTRQAWPR